MFEKLNSRALFGKDNKKRTFNFETFLTFRFVFFFLFTLEYIKSESEHLKGFYNRIPNPFVYIEHENEFRKQALLRTKNVIHRARNRIKFVNCRTNMNVR